MRELGRRGSDGGQGNPRLHEKVPLLCAEKPESLGAFSIPGWQPEVVKRILSLPMMRSQAIVMIPVTASESAGHSPSKLTSRRQQVWTKSCVTIQNSHMYVPLAAKVDAGTAKAQTRFTSDRAHNALLPLTMSGDASDRGGAEMGVVSLSKRTLIFLSIHIDSSYLLTALCASAPEEKRSVATPLDFPEEASVWSAHFMIVPAEENLCRMSSSRAL